MSEQGTHHRERRASLALAVGLAFYLDSATLVCIAVGLPVWTTSFGLSPWQVGLLGGGLAFAMAAGSLLGGHLGDRIGRARVFTIDLAVFAIGAVVLTVAGTSETLIAGAMLVGVSIGADIPTGLAVLAARGTARQRAARTGATQLAWIVAVLVTYSLAVAVSGMGLLGTRLLTGHLIALAAFTLVVRVRQLHAAGPLGLAPVSQKLHDDPFDARSRSSRAALLLPVFYVVWNMAASTLGSYGTYFLVTVTGLHQRVATSLVLVTFLPAAVMALLFIRLADTPWRERLFPVAALLQVAAFGVGALTGGRMISAMIACVVLYSLSNVFGGEAAFKIWAQRLFVERSRATALGASYAAARLVSAAFLTVVPLIIASHPAVLLWLLTSFVVISGGIGVWIIRHQRHE